MKNNKGFTLMELLVAVFISSMVTIALMSIWKASSMQTSQGQRQSIVRNNLSILMRALHRDITESDILVSPISEGVSGVTSTVIVLARNAYLEKRDGEIKVIPNTVSYTKDPGGPQIESEPVIFAYCYDKDEKSIKRSGDLKLIDYPFESRGTWENDIVSECEDGRIYMDYVPKFEIATDDNINYKVHVVVHKDFEGSDTPPIHLEVEKIFTKAGGV